MLVVPKSYEIYLIYNDEFWYVGSTTVGVPRRLRQHFAGSRSSGAPLLSAKFFELGIDAFNHLILSSGVGNPIEAEQRWYDFYKVSDPRQSLNTRRPGAYPPHTPEINAKISAANKGKIVSAETRAKISSTLTGVIFSPEHRAKISANNRNRSPEMLAKIGAAKRGKPLPRTPEHQAKLTAALRGRRQTPEHIANAAAAKRGKKLSLEHRASISAACKATVRKQVACNDCEMVTNPGSIENHLKATGHTKKN